MLEIVGGIVVLAILILLSGLKTVKEHHQLVIYRYGRVADCKGPGLHLIMPLIDHIEMVETRLRTLKVVDLNVTTQEEHAVLISCDCIYYVADAKKAVTKVEDIESAMQIVTESNLRELARQTPLNDLQGDPKRLNSRLKSLMDRQIGNWGLKVSSIEVTTVKVATFKIVHLVEEQKLG